MTRLEFGRDVPPSGKPIPMAYVRRHGSCGHILEIISPRKWEAFDKEGKVVPSGTWGSEPMKLAIAEFAVGPCSICKPPEQETVW